MRIPNTLIIPSVPSIPRETGDGSVGPDPPLLIRPLTTQETNPMASYRKIGRNWFYRYVDANGKQRERKGCSDRRVTEGLAASAEAEVAKIRAGYIDPRDIGYGVHEARPL